MGEELFDVWPWLVLPADDVNPEPEGILNGDDDKLPTEDCLVNSGMLLFPDNVGNPMRSANGCPNASQSFSTSTWQTTKKSLSSQISW